MDLSFSSAYKLMKSIDELPQASQWALKVVTVKGDLVGVNGKHEEEEVELWMRNPVDCVRELMANPDFTKNVSYEPQQAFSDVTGNTCQYDEMWTRDWWWEVQVSKIFSLALEN